LSIIGLLYDCIHACDWTKHGSKIIWSKLVPYAIYVTIYLCRCCITNSQLANLERVILGIELDSLYSTNYTLDLTSPNSAREAGKVYLVHFITLVPSGATTAWILCQYGF